MDRYVVVPELTDDLDTIKALSDHLDNYPNISKIEPLAFYKMGEYKWEGTRTNLLPCIQRVSTVYEKCAEIFATNGKNVIINTYVQLFQKG